MQRAAFGQRAAAHHVETEMQRLRLDAGICADLQPHGGNSPRLLLLRMLLHNLQRVMAKRYFVHAVSGNGNKTAN
ncbi:hypothetical protein D3C80_2102220 [compost metagenome]